MKKVIATLLLAVILCTGFSSAAFAQTGFFLGTNSFSYNGNKYCNCTLTSPGKKNASVKVTLTSTGGLTIRMEDQYGRYIWGEDNSIKGNKSRTYTLGKDHSVYRLFFKSTNGKGTGFVSVSNPKNCSIY